MWNEFEILSDQGSSSARAPWHFVDLPPFSYATDFRIFVCISILMTKLLSFSIKNFSQRYSMRYCLFFFNILANYFISIHLIWIEESTKLFLSTFSNSETRTFLIDHVSLTLYCFLSQLFHFQREQENVNIKMTIKPSQIVYLCRKYVSYLKKLNVFLFQELWTR